MSTMPTMPSSFPRGPAALVHPTRSWDSILRRSGGGPASTMPVRFPSSPGNDAGAGEGCVYGPFIQVPSC